MATPRGAEAATEVHVVDSDARRGSFAGTADLVRRIAPTLCVEDPAAVRRHSVELFTLVPELWVPVGLPAEDLVLSGSPVGAGRSRRYSRLEVTRIAYGLVDLLYAWAATVGHSVVVYDNAGRADATEWELLAVALACLPPELVELVVCGATEKVGEPLAGALRRHTVRVEMPVADRTDGGLCLTSR